MSSHECGVRTRISEVQKVESCSVATLWKTTLKPVQFFQWTGLVCVTDDCSKGQGCHCRTTWLWRTSSPRSICIHSGEKWMTLPNCSEFQSQNVQTYGYVLHVTDGPTSLSNIQDPVVPLERNLYGHPLAGLCGRQLEGILLELRWDRVPNWECLFVHRKHGLCLSVFVDDITMAGTKTDHGSHMCKRLMRNVVDLDGPTSFLDHVYLARTQTWMQAEWNYCRARQLIVRITHFWGSNWKLPGWENFSQKLWRDLTTWKDMLKKMRWVILRVGEQEDGAICTRFRVSA